MCFSLKVTPLLASPLQHVISEIWHHRSANKGLNEWAQVQADTHTHTGTKHVHGAQHDTSLFKMRNVQTCTTTVSVHSPLQWNASLSVSVTNDHPLISKKPPTPPTYPSDAPFWARPPPTRAAIVLNATDKLCVRGWLGK